MIYTALTNKAMRISYEAHKKQFDTSDIPYVFHPYHLAEQMDNETRVCMALLHDVVEDTDVTLEELRIDFPEEVIAGLELLTHGPDKDYFDYVREICKNKDALFVKLADLIHNIDETRLCDLNMSISEKNRWIEKYSKALHIVVKALEKDIPINNTDNSDRILLNRLLKEYRYPDRIVSIECEKNPLDYMTKEMFERLSQIEINEQMKYIYIDTSERVIHDYQYVEEENKLFSERLDNYEYNKILLVSHNVILGLLRINNKCGYKDKNRISCLWLNGELETEEYRYINHSVDHMAVGQNITVCHMYLDTNL